MNSVRSSAVCGARSCSQLDFVPTGPGRAGGCQQRFFCCSIRHWELSHDLPVKAKPLQSWPGCKSICPWNWLYCAVFWPGMHRSGLFRLITIFWCAISQHGWCQIFLHFFYVLPVRGFSHKPWGPATADVSSEMQASYGMMAIYMVKCPSLIER